MTDYLDCNINKPWKIERKLKKNLESNLNICPSCFQVGLPWFYAVDDYNHLHYLTGDRASSPLSVLCVSSSSLGCTVTAYHTHIFLYRGHNTCIFLRDVRT